MNTFKFSGNSRSSDFLRDIKGVFVLNPGTAVAEIRSLAGWQVVTMPETTAEIAATYIPLDRGLEVQTDEAEMTTGATGYTEKTKDFAPRLTGYAKISEQDYRAWFAADQKEFDFIFLLEDGKMIRPPKNSEGKYVGFCGRIFVKFNLPITGGEGKQQAHSFNILLDNVDQFKKYEVTKADFSMCEIKDIIPLGFDLAVQTGYVDNTATGTLVLKATYRGTGAPITNLSAVTNFEVVSAESDVTVEVTAVDDASAAIGVYTLTTTGALTGDFELQGVVFSATPTVTHLSNVINIDV